MSLFHSAVHNIPDLRMSLKELTRKILREIECAESVTNNQKEWEMQEEIILFKSSKITQNFTGGIRIP